MINIKDKLNLIESERVILDENISKLELQFKKLKENQKKIHLEVKKTTAKELDKNLEHFAKNSEIFKFTNNLIDKVQKLHLDKLVWINLSIIYSKIAPTGTSLDLDENEYTNKKRHTILKNILDDLTEKELYEYCSVVSNQIQSLKRAA